MIAAPDWSKPPTMQGEHVQLRALTLDDRDALLAAFADGLDRAFTTVIPNPETIDAWLKERERERVAGRGFTFTVLDHSSRVSGTTRYMRMSAAHKRLEIGGTVYAARVQRTGLNTEAKLLLLRHAFETLGANVVQLRTDWLNRASRQAIERIGAKMDGVLRSHLVTSDGRVRDTVVYSITAVEWPGVRTNLELLLKGR